MVCTVRVLLPAVINTAPPVGFALANAIVLEPTTTPFEAALITCPLIVTGDPPTDRVLDPTTTTPGLPATVCAASVAEPTGIRAGPPVAWTLLFAKVTALEPTCTPLGTALITCPFTVTADPPTDMVLEPTTTSEGFEATGLAVTAEPPAVKTTADGAFGESGDVGLAAAGYVKRVAPTCTPVGSTLTATPETVTAGPPGVRV